MSVFGVGRPMKFRPFSQTGKKPPVLPGVYRIRDLSNRIVYVGEAVNMRKRMHEHIRVTGKLRPGESFEYKVAKPGSSSFARRQVESQKIGRFKPERNLRAGGGGRPAK